MPSGADLEYQRMLKAAGVTDGRYKDGAFLEQLGDTRSLSQDLAAEANTPSSALRLILDSLYVKQANLEPFGQWQAYTPVYSNFPSGFTSVYARYVLLGKLCRVQFRGLFGGIPTGNFRVSLPFPAYGSHPVLRDAPIGTCMITDSTGSVGTVSGNTLLYSDRLSVSFFTASNVVTNDYWNDTLPFVPDTATAFSFNCEYEIA